MISEAEEKEQSDNEWRRLQAFCAISLHVAVQIVVPLKPLTHSPTHQHPTLETFNYLACSTIPQVSHFHR